MKITKVKIADIVVENRYREDMGDIVGLAASIEAKGLLQPITLNENKHLLAGGRRLAAVKALKWDAVDCILRKTEEGIDALEVELIENISRQDLQWTERAHLEKAIFDLRRRADSTWSLDKQAALTGHSKGGVARRITIAGVVEGVPELGEYQSEDKAWKAYKALEERMVIDTLKKRGGKDTTVKGIAKGAKNHFMVGDALERMKGVGANICQFAEVDPPYAIDLLKRKGRSSEAQQLDMYNEVEADKYVEFLTTTAEEVYRILKPNSFCLWWFGMTWYAEVREVLRDVGFKVNDIPAVWTKGGGGQTASPDTMLASGYEPFFLARKGNAKMVKTGRSNVFSFDPVPPQKKIHPTERPLPLMQELLDTFVYPASIILVPFLGSGVTLRATYTRDLVGFGYDLDEMNRRRFLDSVYKDNVDIHKKEG